MEIRLATLADAEGVKKLLRANHVSTVPEEEKKNGFVTTNLTDDQLRSLIEDEKGVMIAVDDAGEVKGFALAASWEYWSQWPLFAYMIEILPQYALDGVALTKENSYQYGPVCVEKSLRGTGVFEKLFAASLASMAPRFPIMATFINHINPRSYAAHTRKVHTTDLGTFDFNGNHYHLMSCPTR